MKTQLFKLAIILSLCTFAYSCEKDLEEIPDFAKTEEKTINPRHLAIIESLGFSTKDIIEEDDCYVVEGDIIIVKDGIELYLSEENSDQPKTRQSRWGTKVGPNIIQDVTVSTAYLTNDKWKAALLEAMRLWNDIPNCNVHFKHQVFARVTVHMNSTIEGVADAGIPMAKNPGVWIRINSNYNYYSHAQKVYVMVHELGHIVGLGHTDYRTNNEPIGNSGNGTSQIAGTPIKEDDSVMDSHSGGRYWGNWGWASDGYRIGQFTPGDILAIQSLYGNAPYWVSISGPAALLPGQTATYDIACDPNLQAYAADFISDWGVAGNKIVIERWADSSVTLRNDDITLRPFTISATTDYNGRRMYDDNPVNEWGATGYYGLNDRTIASGTTETISGDGIWISNVAVKGGATLALNAPSVTINDGFIIDEEATFIIGE